MVKAWDRMVHARMMERLRWYRLVGIPWWVKMKVLRTWEAMVLRKDVGRLLGMMRWWVEGWWMVEPRIVMTGVLMGHHVHATIVERWVRLLRHLLCTLA